jgi:hypothetical protein
MISHVLLTRYNLPSPGVESLIRAKDGWLRERTNLFERYTVPSVRSQTSDNHAWIVYLDPESPGWLVETMRSLEQQQVLTPLYRGVVEASDLVWDVRRATGRSRGPLITTNLDNDDALATDFVARLQQNFVSGTRAAVYFDRGLIMSGSSIYLRRDRYNAFCSVYEDIEDPVTCWADWHNRLPLHMPVVHLPGSPAWLQVIHGTNVSNRVRGRRVHKGSYVQSFGQLLDGVREPTAAEVGRDTLVGWPSRLLRDGGRSAVKNAILRVGGKDGLNKIKTHLASRASPD